MSNDKKMVFFKWWPDDVLNGCSLLTWQSELTYRRIMDKKLEKLFDDYEGNLLNYFSGLTPEQSKEFNKKQKKWRKK